MRTRLLSGLAAVALVAGTGVAAAAPASAASCWRESGWVAGKAQSYTQRTSVGCYELGARHTFRVPGGGTTVHNTGWTWSTSHVVYSKVSASPYTLVAYFGANR